MSHPINDLYFEERAYRKFVTEKKNSILRLSDERRKQAAWNTLFPPVDMSDDWLLSAVNF